MRAVTIGYRSSTSVCMTTTGRDKAYTTSNVVSHMYSCIYRYTLCTPEEIHMYVVVMCNDVTIQCMAHVSTVHSTLLSP